MTRAGGDDHPTRDRWGLVSVPVALAAFPISEIALRGRAAVQYAHDVFDEGSVTRLGIVRHDWLANGLTLWDPHLTSGNALWSQFAMPPVALDTLLSLMVGPFAAYALTYLLLIWLAGVGMYVFCRQSLGLSPIAALVGSIGYELVFWQYSLGFTAPLLPAALWLVDCPPSSRLRGWRGIVLLTLLLVLALYDGQLQIAVFLGAAQVVWLVTTPRAGPMGGRVIVLGVAWVSALLIYAPVILADAVALPGSQRAFWDLNVGNSVPAAVGQVIQSYAALILGLPGAGGWGALSPTYGTFFAGAVGLPLVVVGIVADSRGRTARTLQIALLAIPLLDGLGAAVTVALSGHLGVLGSFQLIRIRHLYPAVVWACAAVGAGVLFVPRPVAAGRWRAALLSGSLIGALAAAWMLRRSLAGPLATAAEPAAREAAVLGVVVGVLCLVTSGMLLLASLRVRRRLAWLPLALVLLLVCDRMAYGRVQALSAARAGPISPIASWEGRVASNAAIDYLTAHVQPGDRVLTMASQPLASEPNRLALAGLDLADGYQNVYPHGYQLVFGQMVAANLADPGMARYFFGWGNRAYALGSAVSLPIADLLGVRWIYADGITPVAPGLIRVVSFGAVTIWENRDAFPRAFVVTRVRRFADLPTLAASLGRATAAELATSAYVTSDPGLVAPAEPSAAVASVTMGIDRPDAVSLDVVSSAPGILVLRDTMAAGWMVTVNGRSRAIVTVDGTLAQAITALAAASGS